MVQFRLRTDFIRFDPTFVDRQRLKLTFENVDTATLSGLHVDEALEVRAKTIFKFSFNFFYCCDVILRWLWRMSSSSAFSNQLLGKNLRRNT